MVAIASGSGNRGAGTDAGPTVGDALEATVARLEAAGLCFGHGTDSAWDEGVLLVLAACDLPVDAGDEVLAKSLSAASQARIAAWLDERIGKRVPLPYLLGRAWFAGLEFRCDRRALVPRSPLAEVIDDGFSPWWGGKRPRRVLDLCCGGGAIGIAAAVHHPDLDVILADIDTGALALAEENVALHGVGARVSLVKSDLFEQMPSGVFDIILCNPPYVDAADMAAMPPEFAAEPALGLAAGTDGLDLVRRIFQRAPEWMRPHSLLFLEVGNSWVALDEALADQAPTWLQFRDGGHGVAVFTRDDLVAASRALLPPA